MSTVDTTVSLLNLVKIGKLGKGIHDNVVITKLDVEDRKSKNGPINKMIYITFTTIDPTTKKRKAEVEVSWWKLDTSSDYFFTNMREFCIQLNGILTCYMNEDDAFESMKSAFDGFAFKSVNEIEAYAWKIKEAAQFVENVKTAFAAAITPFIGVDAVPFRLKLVLDSKGENVAVPSYGVFTESMSVTETKLRFSDTELKNMSKAGNTSVIAGKKASAALSL